ncbi:unnamed protein product [Medioppia subpectinata]|uniref:Protein kinase domain-containing protein n=1 Tax=Medioppia subpectinata TaxID=1979941 RepID=A0A7R9PUR2_9ACAR|nr:unnamed protein product [Medioppia subpectinata]CAG2101044.1 unnamed protein product [Medioppia subpectinata]
MSKAGDKYDFPPHHEKRLQEKGYTISTLLNSGKYGLVCNGSATVNGSTINTAVKIIDLTKTSADYRNKFLPKELYSLDTLKHEFIIKIYDIILITNTVYVFMERADGGDLFDMLKDSAYKSGIPEPKAKILYKGIASALQYIHGRGWAHRDLKSENVLLNADKTIAKLTDFGFSTSCFNTQTGEKVLKDTYCGSPFYAAPEVLRAQPYDAFKTDVWSMGVVLYIMVNNKMPFSNALLQKLAKLDPNSKTPIQITKNSISNDCKDLMLCKTPIQITKNSISNDCKDLMQKQLDINTRTRIDMAHVLSHQWFK